MKKGEIYNAFYGVVQWPGHFLWFYAGHRLGSVIPWMITFTFGCQAFDINSCYVTEHMEDWANNLTIILTLDIVDNVWCLVSIGIDVGWPRSSSIIKNTARLIRHSSIGPGFLSLGNAGNMRDRSPHVFWPHTTECYRKVSNVKKQKLLCFLFHTNPICVYFFNFWNKSIPSAAELMTFSVFLRLSWHSLFYIPYISATFA
jgi:hypothetical protein